MDINRLRWASRRGMLELDLILGPFLDNVFPGLDEADKLRFESLLTSEDQDLYNWLMRRDDPSDPELLAIVEIIRANTGLQPGDY